MFHLENTLASVVASTNPVGTFTLRLAATGGLIVGALSTMDPWAALLVAALLFGWSEMDGFCGSSHVCTLTPLRAFESSATWWKSVSAYTGAGGLTAASVGLLLGSAGAMTLPRTDIVLMGVILAACVLAARELNLVRFAIPQVHRQTDKMWAFQFGIVTAAGMWGSHIGLGFATVIKHGGYLVLVPLAASLGPTKGALLMVVYWAGRSLPLWIVPLLTPQVADGGTLGKLLTESELPCRYVAATGLLGAAVATSLLL